MLAFLCANPSIHAEESPGIGPHVRSLMPGVERLIADAESRSPTVCTLLDRLEQSDLVAYVQERPFGSRETTGHLIFLAATLKIRYVVIEIASGESWNTQLATLGHELRHAIEIAETRWIRSTENMEAYYRDAGADTGAEHGHLAFETQAAAQAGQQVARELLIWAERPRAAASAPLVAATR